MCIVFYYTNENENIALDADRGFGSWVGKGENLSRLEIKKKSFICDTQTFMFIFDETVKIFGFYYLV